MTQIWYRVRDLDAARRFYAEKLAFEEAYYDADGRWAQLKRGETELGLAEGEPEEGGVAHVDVADVKQERQRLLDEGVDVGVVFELHGEMRLLDVFDLDGNRIQLAEELSGA